MEDEVADGGVKRLVGMDYWGAQWNYAKEQCEKNAAIEGVASRIHFEKGNAAHLNYADETFDAAYKMSRPNVQKILYKNVQLVCLS